MPKTQQKAKIVKAEDLKNIRYPLPESWKKAIGILKNKKIDPLQYQKQIRKGWEKRLKKQIRLARNGS